MHKLSAICDYEAMLRYLANQPEIPPPYKKNSARRRWEDAIDFLFYRVPELYLDVPEEFRSLFKRAVVDRDESAREELESKYEFLYTLLLERRKVSSNPDMFSGLLKGVDGYEYHTKKAPSFAKVDNPWRFFLLNDTENAPEISRYYGALAANADDLAQRVHGAFQTGSLVVSSEEPAHGYNWFSGWEDIEQFALPVTDVVIEDCYLLTGRSEFEENILPLLKSLLTEKSVYIKTCITLIGGELDHRFKSDGYMSLEAVSSLVGDYLEDSGTGYEITVLSQPGCDDLHPRRIYTNYGYFKSGHSFNKFMKDGKVNLSRESLDFKPYVPVNTDPKKHPGHEDGIKNLHELHNLVSRYRENEGLRKQEGKKKKGMPGICGSGENRLLKSAALLHQDS